MKKVSQISGHFLYCLKDPKYIGEVPVFAQRSAGIMGGGIKHLKILYSSEDNLYTSIYYTARKRYGIIPDI